MELLPSWKCRTLSRATSPSCSSKTVLPVLEIKTTRHARKDVKWTISAAGCRSRRANSTSAALNFKKKIRIKTRKHRPSCCCSSEWVNSGACAPSDPSGLSEEVQRSGYVGFHRQKKKKKKNGGDRPRTLTNSTLCFEFLPRHAALTRVTACTRAHGRVESPDVSLTWDAFTSHLHAESSNSWKLEKTT